MKLEIIERQNQCDFIYFFLWSRMENSHLSAILIFPPVDLHRGLLQSLQVTAVCEFEKTIEMVLQVLHLILRKYELGAGTVLLSLWVFLGYILLDVCGDVQQVVFHLVYKDL